MSPSPEAPVEPERLPSLPASSIVAGVPTQGSAPAGPSMMTALPPGMVEMSMTVLPHASVTLDAQLAEKLLDFIL